jgi:hypothetical protein
MQLHREEFTSPAAEFTQLAPSHDHARCVPATSYGTIRQALKDNELVYVEFIPHRLNIPIAAPMHFRTVSRRTDIGLTRNPCDGVARLAGFCFSSPHTVLLYVAVRLPEKTAECRICPCGWRNTLAHQRQLLDRYEQTRESQPENADHLRQELAEMGASYQAATTLTEAERKIGGWARWDFANISHRTGVRHCQQVAVSLVATLLIPSPIRALLFYCA